MRFLLVWAGKRDAHGDESQPEVDAERGECAAIHPKASLRGEQGEARDAADAAGHAGKRNRQGIAQREQDDAGRDNRAQGDEEGAFAGYPPFQPIQGQIASSRTTPAKSGMHTRL